MENQPRDFGTGHPLHRSEIHTVQAIGDEPGIGVTRLAEILDITKGAVSQMVAKLVRKKLVEKTYSRENARDVRLLLTPLGKIAYHGHDVFHEEMQTLIRDYLQDRFEDMNQRFYEVFLDLEHILDLIEKSGKHR